MKVVEDSAEYIGSVDVAKLLDISPDDVSLMARKGVLPGHKGLKIWRFNKLVVTRMINTHKLIRS